MHDRFRRAFASSTAVALIVVLTGTAPWSQAAHSPQSVARCGPPAGSSLSHAPQVQVSDPTPEARLNCSVDIAGTIFSFELGSAIDIALRNAAGGTLAASFADREPGDNALTLLLTTHYRLTIARMPDD